MHGCQFLPEKVNNLLQIYPNYWIIYQILNQRVLVETITQFFCNGEEIYHSYLSLPMYILCNVDYTFALKSMLVFRK